MRRKGLSGFVNSSLPPSQENAVWGWIRRNILGTGGRFNQSVLNLYPINPKTVLIDMSPGELMSVAMEHPHLNTVLHTGARIFSMMEIRHVDKDGQDVENSEVLRFLKNPNPLQSQIQYLYHWYVMNGIYNKTFQHMIRGLSYKPIPDVIWILPSGWMTLNLTGKIFRQSKIEDIIVNYKMQGEEIPFEVKNIIYMTEGLGNVPLTPISRVQALQIPLSNIRAAIMSRNIIITQRGPNGFIAADSVSNDGEGAIPFDEDEANKMRKEFKNKYSLDSEGGHVAFTKSSIKFVSMAYDIKQLQLIEGVEDDFAVVLAAFMHDRDIYPSVKGATFENKQAGMKYTIQNGMQPLADTLMEQFSKNMIDPNTGEKLLASYEKVPAMQADKLKSAQAKFNTARSLSIALHDGVIDHESYAEELDMEMTGDSVIVQSNPQNNTNDATSGTEQN